MVNEDGRERAPNIFDVARLAGVSHQTVSRVINDHPNVRDSTRERVQKAVRQLRYRPSTAARAMVRRRSRNLGLITTGSPDYGPASTVLGFTAAAREARYTVSIAPLPDSDPDYVRASVELLLSQSIEAVVVLATRRSLINTLAAVELDLPVVAVDPSGVLATTTVAIDQYAGARRATGYLISQGHRSIVHLAGPADSIDAAERTRGWQDAMTDYGLAAPTPAEGDWSPASGYAFGRQLGSGVSGLPTAVFSSNDQMALGLLHALRDRGLDVPADISVMGFDDIPEAEHVVPPLTTMRQDFVQLGHDIMATVLHELEELDFALPRSLPQLVVRESVRALSGAVATERLPAGAVARI
ncbi:LacI family DNA-binding transcriptional regulator [Microlunatus capsulatus]|uniref:DNA-binding LacI/PurR family transcriptional regulator n=1 Tax=Microlunatus capsulatus TaxID=99117 RepID=A0ABS4Z997_9ACTN|nr:LacI family DNA-binding transcriptional regulator [Microlunatus capsulatus]MBP2417626.1 DNA-binding LacI/PurR family transcriptional regulator [Microlunatus capsulatus]